jgi:glutamate/aspartate transport system substrate-binding protein
MKASLTALAVLTLLATPLGTAAEAGTLDKIKESGTIKIGFREAEPPMSFLDQNGKAVGYSIELCERVVTAVKSLTGNTGITVDYVPVTSENRFSALKDGAIDILCGSTTKTLSRGELVDFTQLTFVTGASLLSLSNARVSGVAALQGKKVAVVHDTTTIDVLKKTLEGSLIEAEVIPVDSAAEGMMALKNGEVDAFSSDQVVLIGLVLTSENKGDYFVASELFSFEPFALAVRRNDADFRLVADRVLSRLNRSGQINDIYRRWFGAFSKKRPIMLDALYQLNATPE